MSSPSEKKKENSPSAGSANTRRSLRNEHEKEVAEARKKFLEMGLDEKRKLYKCKNKFTVLSDVPTWPAYFSAHLKDDEGIAHWWKINKKKVETEPQEAFNEKLSIFRGDITTLEIDAIANAANESLLGGGGVDGAIHAAAGFRLRSECELLNGCEAGDAKITCGYKLPAKYVVHTVGPRGEQPERLKSCYSKCLQLLKENKLKSIAFPCISTGIFGYPNLNAARVALETIRDFLEKDEYGPKVERIILCLFMKKDVEIYHEQMQLFFPLGDRSKDSNENQGSSVDPEPENRSESTPETAAVSGDKKEARNEDTADRTEKEDTEDRTEKDEGTADRTEKKEDTSQKAS